MGGCEYWEGLGLACTPRPLPCYLVLLGTKRLRGHDGAVTGLSWAAVEVLVQMPDPRAVGETDRPAPASASGVDYRCAQPLMPDAGLRKEGPSLSWLLGLFVRGVAVRQRQSRGCPGWDKMTVLCEMVLSFKTQVANRLHKNTHHQIPRQHRSPPGAPVKSGCSCRAQGPNMASPRKMAL